MTKIFKKSKSFIRENLVRGRIRISVFGLGRVGLPLAIAFLRSGAKVTGTDIDHRVVDSINRGISHISDEPEISEAVKEFVSKRRFNASCDLAESSLNSDVKIVVVPTNLENKRADLSALREAIEQIGMGLNKDDIVIIESTVPPLTTKKLVAPLLQETSGLIPGEEFGLATSPERVMVGEVLNNLKGYPKIIGGINNASTNTVASLYEQVFPKVIRVKDSTTAEVIKIFEGIYRDINIALANEMSKFCDAIGVDFLEVRNAANSQPYCQLHLPGCGVGGHCIPYYPYFLLEVANQIGVPMTLTRTGREINESMPSYTVNLLKQGMNLVERSFNNEKIAILGAAFRGNISQCKNVPAKGIIREIENLGARVVVYDPLVSRDTIERELSVSVSDELEEALREASAMVIHTDHDVFKEIDLEKANQLMKSPAVIIDGRNIFDEKQIPPEVVYLSVGRSVLNRKQESIF